MYEEQIAVVEAYINHRRGITIKIDLSQFKYNPLAVIRLHTAYQFAKAWFAANDGGVREYNSTRRNYNFKKGGQF